MKGKVCRQCGIESVLYWSIYDLLAFDMDLHQAAQYTRYTRYINTQIALNVH